jgi:proline iminopeptidase
MSAVAPSSTGLSFEEVGRGAPCLVAHGGPGLHHGPYRSLDRLGAVRRLVYWDHRGHGRSDPLPATRLTIGLFADDAVRLADDLELETFDLFGHSFGGWVAQEVALRYPERVSTLILASTTPGQLGSTESEADDQGPPMPSELAELMSQRPSTDAELVALYRTLAPHFTRSVDAAALTDFLDPVLVSAGSFGRVLDEALADWSSVDRLGTVRCPTLVLGGRHDRFCSPPQLQRIAARVPDAKLRWFENSGHFMWLEEPDAFFELVTGWLRRH